MTPAQLKEYLELAPSSPLLLDVRQGWEYDICALNNSILIPMGQIPTRLDELDPEQEIVVICHHGIRSANVCRYLEANGYDKMINLQGGVAAWAQDIDPQMATY